MDSALETTFAPGACPHVAMLLSSPEEVAPTLASFYALGAKRNGWLCHRSLAGRADCDRAALIAAGLDGVDRGLQPPEPVEGNAYLGDLERVPSSLRDARDAFAASSFTREAFGDEVVEHYLNNARVELEAFDAAVTDWERVRGFERL